MKLIRIALIAFGIAVLAGIGLAGYKFKTAEFDAEYAVLLEDVQAVKQVNADIDRLSLKSRFGLDSDYDRLAQMSQQLGSLTTTIGEQISQIGNEETADLTAAFGGFETQVTIKNDLTENFKSHNSVLRNSVNYAPLVGERLVEAAMAAELITEAELLAETVNEVNKYALATGQGGNERLRVLLDELRGIDERLPESSRVMALEFANHVRTLIQEKNVTDQYLTRVVESLVPQDLATLENALNGFYNRVSQQSRQANLMLLGYLAVLLLGFLVLAYKLRSLYQRLEFEVDKRTRKIEQANQNLKESQQQLIQSEKMASLGQMVAGIAHEINTPLSYVSSNVDVVRLNVGNLDNILICLEKMSQTLAQDNPDPQRIKKLLARMMREYRGMNSKETFDEIRDLLKDSSYGLQEISELVSGLKDFSRVDRASAELFDLHDSLEKTLKICGGQISEQVKIEKDYGELPSVECAPSQINQVFLNIIMNASQAMGEKGSLRIKTFGRKDEVTVAIQDTGCGMSKEVQEKIFDPFFTTKDIGKGTGLGLSICYKIIKSHGGSISVDSVVGRGTTFLITLPVRQGQAARLVSVEQAG